MMWIKDKNIDNGNAFDFGKTSADYAKYRDIYPQIFYEKILDRNLCIRGQRVLDIGTGTGVLPSNSFDVITACQCFFYFDHEKVAPIFKNILKPNGSMLILYMAWLPFEDEIAGASEKLVLKYNPDWSSAGEKMRPIELSNCYKKYFDIIYSEEYPIDVHFTRSSWNGRMKACRGIGATLSNTEIERWEQEHLKMLSEIAPEEFDILHYGAILELKVNK